MAKRRDPRPEHQIDLHGLGVAGALRRLAQELHAARVRGLRHTLVITGRGFGSRDGAGVLTPEVARWLAGPEAKRLGVRSFRSSAKGGAWLVELDAAGGGSER